MTGWRRGAGADGHAGRGRLRHRKRAAVALLVAVLLVPASPSLAKKESSASKKPKDAAPSPKRRLDSEGIYAMTMSRSSTGLHIVEYWSRGATLRAHTTISGHPFVTIVLADTYYVLDPVMKRGVAVPRSPRAKAADAGRRRLFGNEFEDMLKAGAEKVRTEQSPAGPLDVYRLTDDDGRRTVWVTSDEYRLPLKFETFDRRTGNEASLEYLSWSPLRLTESFFEPPAAEWDIEHVESYDAWLRADPSTAFKQAPIIFPLLLHGRP